MPTACIQRQNLDRARQHVGGKAEQRLAFFSRSLPRLYAFRASSEDVVACASGTSNFCTVASDSPSSPRSFDAASPSVSSTFSLEAAVACSSASVSPLWQSTAFSPNTYSLPRLVIDLGKVRLAARPLAQLAGHFRRELRVSRKRHLLQGRRYLVRRAHSRKAIAAGKR